MRVVVAPDSFGGTLSAPAAADAMSRGWRRGDPEAVIDRVPMSDGGPGLVEVLHAAAGGEVRQVTVTGPLGAAVRAGFLLDGRTAVVESAQACGLHLVPPAERDALATTTLGVGELVRAAVDAGARRIVVGLGGSSTTDGGAGMLAALGARLSPSGLAGGGSLPRVARADLAPARDLCRDVELVAATDVDNPLLGPNGAAAVFGPQKGASPEDVQALERGLSHWVDVLSAQVPSGTADRPGAGAAGGLGFALFALGAARQSGVEMVMEAVDLQRRAAAADLVLTGEGSLDAQSLRGKVVAGVAAAARAAGRPCLVLAGQVHIDRPDLQRAGVDSAYSLLEVAGSVQEAMGHAAAHLSALAEQVALTRSA
jgi:glycerate kinase